MFLECEDKLLIRLVKYYGKFGGRSCCFSDFSPYIDALSEDNRNEVSYLFLSYGCFLIVLATPLTLSNSPLAVTLR